MPSMMTPLLPRLDAPSQQGIEPCYSKPEDILGIDPVKCSKGTVLLPSLGYLQNRTLRDLTSPLLYFTPVLLGAARLSRGSC